MIGLDQLNMRRGDSVSDTGSLDEVSFVEFRESYVEYSVLMNEIA